MSKGFKTILLARNKKVRTSSFWISETFSGKPAISKETLRLFRIII